MRNKIKKLLTGIIVVSLVASFSIGSPSVRGISTAQGTFWPPNSRDWTEVAPETQGINPDKIDEMFEYINSSQIDIHSIVIARNGYLLLEEYLWESQIYRNMTGDKEYSGGYTTHMQQSTTKSIMSILIGIALQEGLLDNLSHTLYQFYSDIWEPTFLHGEQKKSITIEQLLTMNSGLSGSIGYPSGSKSKLNIDCINFVLNEVPLKFTPGQTGVYEYSNDGVNLLSGIIANISGMSTEEFAQQYLFDPLQISKNEYEWWNDSKGMDFGGYGLSCTPKVQAKLGILALNSGNWDGEQIADLNFMKNATTQQNFAYGYLWWMMYDGSFEGYYAAGAGGQTIYVIPEYSFVVGFTASNGGPYTQMIVDYILQFVEILDDPLIPGFEINLTLLVVFCTTVVLIIIRKKNSKNK